MGQTIPTSSGQRAHHWPRIALLFSGCGGVHIQGRGEVMQMSMMLVTQKLLHCIVDELPNIFKIHETLTLNETPEEYIQ